MGWQGEPVQESGRVRCPTEEQIRLYTCICRWRPEKAEWTGEADIKGTHREEQGQESLWASLGTEHKGNFCFPGNKLFAQVVSLAICTAGLGLWFICQENDSSGKRTHFPENSCPSEGCSTDTTSQSSCVPAISLFSLLGLFTHSWRQAKTQGSALHVWGVPSCICVAFQSGSVLPLTFDSIPELLWRN